MNLIPATKEEKEGGWVFTEDTLLAVIEKVEAQCGGNAELSLETVDNILGVLLAEGNIDDGY